MTDSATAGSGFLCLDNDDATAERFATLLDEAGLSPAQMNPWNAYPWYINRVPRTAELAAGVDPLRRLLERLPNLRVIMLNGTDAAKGWKLFSGFYPAAAVKYKVLS